MNTPTIIAVAAALISIACAVYTLGHSHGLDDCRQVEIKGAPH